MLIALAFVGIACLLMPSMGSFAMTKFLFAVTGTSFALIKVSVYATIGIVTKDKKEHASFMDFIESFFMIGILTGYFIFSAFVDDNNLQSTSWLNVYYLLAGIVGVTFLLLFTAQLDESQVQSAESKPLMEDFADMIKLAIQPLVLVFIISAFIYVLIEQSIMSWLPTFNSKVLITIHAEYTNGKYISSVHCRGSVWCGICVAEDSLVFCPNSLSYGCGRIGFTGYTVSEILYRTCGDWVGNGAFGGIRIPADRFVHCANLSSY